MGFPSLVRTGTAGTLPATLDIAAVPARTAMVPSGRQAATKAASRFCMIGRARMARMARMATVQHRLKCSVERQSPSYRRDGDRKASGMNGRLGRLALDRRVDWLEGCSSEESVFPGRGTINHRGSPSANGGRAFPA